MNRYQLVICAVNSKYIHSSLAPWCLFAGIKEYAESITACVVEGTVNESAQETVRRILEKEPDAVSFSCYIWNIRRTLAIAKSIKEALPNTKIILGGPEVAYHAKQVLEENAFVDYILSGDGEEALAACVLSLSRGKLPPDGCAHYIGKNGYMEGKHHIFTGELSPYCKEYFSSLSGRIAYIEASRGCPYSCAFCLSGVKEPVRFFNMERVKKEMLALSQSGSQTVKFVDRTSNCNKQRFREILHIIKSNYAKEIPDSVCFHFEIAADILDEETLALIAQMPPASVQFEAGIQSFNEKTLEAVSRKTDEQKLCRNIKKLVSFKNCHIHTDLIAGLPYENLESFKESFNKAYALGANMLQLGFLKILHGSCLEKRAEAYSIQYSKEPPYEVQSTPWLSADELALLHRVDKAVDRLHNSARFKRTLAYILSVCEKSAFDVFCDFSAYAEEKSIKNASLDVYTEWVYEFFSTYRGIDKAVLRDKMICDRIATNSSGVIPSCLQVPDRKLKEVKALLSRSFPEKKCVKRCAAILYSENRAVFCDYDKKDRVSSEYALGIMELE